MNVFKQGGNKMENLGRLVWKVKTGARRDQKQGAGQKTIKEMLNMG